MHSDHPAAASKSTDNPYETRMSERDVLEEWPCLSKSRLREARKAETIKWTKGKRGTAWYTRPAIEDFIKRELEIECLDLGQNRSGNLKGTGSPTNPVQKTSTISGMTQELVEQAARASEQRILNPQSASSRS
ncbi:MAG: hypothetical protein P4L57_15550 [Rhizomicrobium sp.]|nr:hypothetical protein [Rhizomicrobium sp.]